MRVTADHIACALTRPSGPFPYRRYLVVPNLSWGLDLDGEADVVALSPAGYLSEIEIKISIADYRRDADKWRWRRANPCPSLLVSAFYYAMPVAVWQKVAAEFNADAAGLILYEDGRAHTVHAAPSRPCRKLTDAERLQLGRLGTMRYWTRLSHKLDGNLDEKEAA